MKIWQVIAIGIVFVVCGGFIVDWVGDRTYSEGFRDGNIQKLNDKRFFRHSHEGEMAMAGFKMKGESTSNTWEFSVDNDSIWAELQSLSPDTQVRLHYRQVFSSLGSRYETDYRIIRVEIIKQ